VRDFGVKLLNRVDKQKFFFHYPLVISYYCFLFLSMLIYGVSYHQCLLNKCQEESIETGINRRYKNSCLPLKKTHFGFFEPHRTVLINNKTTKQHYLFFYYIYGLLPARSPDTPGR